MLHHYLSYARKVHNLSSFAFKHSSYKNLLGVEEHMVENSLQNPDMVSGCIFLEKKHCLITPPQMKES